MSTEVHPGHAPDTSTTFTSETAPGRRVLLVLGAVYLLLFGVLMATGVDRSPDDDPAALIAGYEVSQPVVQVMTYATMVAAAVLVFFGAALRSVLNRRGRGWTADVALIGFVVMGWTVASFAVSALGLFHAVQSGDPQVVRALNILDTSNFPPAMIGLMCAMIGVGIASLAGRALPAWLAWGSVLLGCLAPLGPAGFVPFLVFPLWVVLVASLVRYPEA